MNLVGALAIYKAEMYRAWRTVFQSVVSPVISTALYFVVFGSAVGHKMQMIHGVPYGAFIVPGLTMLAILTQSIANASFGIYLPRFNGSIYEILSAPIAVAEMLIGYVGAAATKATLIGLIILATARIFVPYEIAHPLWAVAFLMLTAITFSLFGFILGLWAEGFEKLQIVPLLIVTPLTFLGGTFYSLEILPRFWQVVSWFNPVVYLISGFRWAFFGVGDVPVALSLGMTLAILAGCIGVVAWIFRTGYRLRA